MTSVVLNFDASTVEPSAQRGVIPAGDYNLCLTDAEQKETKLKDGHYLALDYIVQDGEHQGRHIYANLNLWNKSKQAREIAWADLSALAHACGVLQVGTADQLFGILISATIGVEQDEKYGPSNRIKSVQAVGNAPAQTWGAAPGGPAAPDASAPWNKAPAEAAPAPAEAAPAATAPAPAAAAAPENAAAAPAAPTEKPPWAA